MRRHLRRPEPIAALALMLAAAPAHAVLSFAARTDHAVNQSPRQVVAAQLNNAGNTDLVAATEDGDPSAFDGSVLLSNGAGTFAAQQPLSTGVADVFSSRVTVYDGDGDGDPDLLFGGGTAQFRPYLNNGTGTFTWFGAQFEAAGSPTAVTSALLDGGLRDLVYATGTTLRTKSDTINLTSTPPLVSGVVDADYAIAGAFNGPALNDLALAVDGNETVRVLLDCTLTACASSTPVTVHSGPVWLDSGDLDGDGDTDLVSANTVDDDVSVLLNDGSGTFTVASHLAMHENPLSVSLGDVNADGRLDIATSSAAVSNVAIRVNNGDASGFGAVQTVATQTNAQTLELADFSGDAFADVAAAQTAANTVGVAINSTPTGAVNPSPEFGSFGGQVVNTTSAPITFTITNTGSATVNIGAFTVPAQFLVPGVTNTCAGAMLLQASSCTFDARFAPDSLGVKAGSIEIGSTASEGSFRLGLRGTSLTPPVVGVAPSSLAFGNQTAGTISPTRAVTITNSGQAPATLSAIALGGADAGQYALSHTCGPLPAQLPGGGQCTASVAFAPAATGAKTATLSVAHNAAGSPHTVSLDGTGTAPPASPGSPSPPASAAPIAGPPLAPPAVLPAVRRASISGAACSYVRPRRATRRRRARRPALRCQARVAGAPAGTRLQLTARRGRTRVAGATGSVRAGTTTVTATLRRGLARGTYRVELALPGGVVVTRSVTV